MEKLRANALLKHPHDRLGALTGMVLGDGWIDISSRTYALGLQHAMRQRDYCKFKVELLEKITGKTVWFREYPDTRWPHVRAKVCHRELFKPLYERLYPNGRKTITDAMLNQLSPIGLAIWYMDDGNLALHRHPDGRVSWREATLSTNCFTDQEHGIMIAWFKRRYNIEARRVKVNKYIRLRFNAGNANLLFGIIAKYVPDCMRYKIDMQYTIPLREFTPRATGRPKMNSVLHGDVKRSAEMTGPDINDVE